MDILYLIPVMYDQSRLLETIFLNSFLNFSDILFCMVNELFDSLTVRPEDIVRAIRSPFCTVFKGAVGSYERDNSVVFASQFFPLFRTYFDTFPEMGQDMNVGITYLKISGSRSNEPLHYHTADIVGLITVGSGVLLYENNGERREEAVEGDMIVIPKGALHCFDCSPGKDLHYAAILLGKEIDYQRHHFDPAEDSALRHRK